MTTDRGAEEQAVGFQNATGPFGLNKKKFADFNGHVSSNDISDVKIDQDPPQFLLYFVSQESHNHAGFASFTPLSR